MAVILQLKSGNWRVQVRYKGKYASQTFKRKCDADRWARQTEVDIDNGRAVTKRIRTGAQTFGDLIDLHLDDLAETGQGIGRSKENVLRRLKEDIGDTPVHDMTKQELLAFGRRRAKEGAGPATLAIDFSFIGTVLTNAAAIHDVRVDPEQMRLARYALVRLGLVGKARERDRRPSAEELKRILNYFDAAVRLEIPMGRIVRFAIATAMRSEEIHRIRWADLDLNRKTVLVRDRKDPRRKQGNNQLVPLVAFTGFDALALLDEQRERTGRRERCFPYNHRSSEKAFQRCIRELAIEDLHFHDMRHEATSRLFEANLSIEQVSLITGHKDWKQLRRYTNLRPEHLHTLPNKPLVLETGILPDKEAHSPAPLPDNVVPLRARAERGARPS